MVAHLGGISFLVTLAGGGYVDISGTLLWFAERYGVPFCERLPRRIGVDRLLFATGFSIYPYETYYEILGKMHFPGMEVEEIAQVSTGRILPGCRRSRSRRRVPRSSRVGL